MNILEKYDIDTLYTGKVIKSHKITPDESSEEVRDIQFEIDNPLFRPEVGQSIGVLVPGPHEFGNENHFRLYSISDMNFTRNIVLITICVKRCFYVDEVNGERYRGVASNYLCDLQPEQEISITGPYGIAFNIPRNKDANLIMIGMGTGIAPFRSFIKHIYKTLGGWQGKVRLFYGARSGLELLYMNERNNDLTLYYDEETFQALQAVSPRPYLGDDIALAKLFERNKGELISLIEDPKTFIYVAGINKLKEILNSTFYSLYKTYGSWYQKQYEIENAGRWSEILY